MAKSTPKAHTIKSSIGNPRNPREEQHLSEQELFIVQKFRTPLNNNKTRNTRESPENPLITQTWERENHEEQNDNVLLMSPDVNISNIQKIPEEIFNQ